MGFGILFFGYFITFLLSLNAYGPIFALIGNYIIFTALQKLSEYKQNISRCIPFLLLMAICNLFSSVEVLFSADFGIAKTIIETVSLTSTLLFNIFLFLSLLSLGEDTEVEEVKSSAKANIALVIAYFAVNVLLIFSVGNKYILLVGLLLRLLFPLFALALIYKCFRFICDPDDLDMPTKPSRFNFINKMHERQAQKEKEAIAAREEAFNKKSVDPYSQPKKRKKKK